jgi:hypothetical protein
MLGRLMFHAKQVQAGKRKSFTWLLLWDIPIAVGMGWMALGIASLTSMPWEATVSLGMASSYIGPYGIDRVFVKWSDMKFGKVTPENVAD